MPQIDVQKQYLWFPVRQGGERKPLFIYDGDTRIFEFAVAPGNDAPDFYAALNINDWMGKTLALSGEFPDAFFENIRQEDQKPAGTSRRPRLHFAPEIGWMNDPNGLVYQDGEYHMCFQYNPFDTEWGNMTWGYAKSADLIHWQELDPVLYPDETGTMFSGCAYIDRENAAGFGKDARLYYYTAAGNNGEWSKGKPSTQHLAVTTDGGRTVEKKGMVLDTVERDNRDPKVYYHAPSKGYFMVLFLVDNDFAVFRSENLKDWSMTQRITLPGAAECPDLFELPVDGDQSNTKWIYWSADSCYYVGSFDGYTFTPEQEKRYAYCNKIAYAAQTVYGAPDRLITIPWLRTGQRELNGKKTTYHGLMGVPAVLSLTKDETGYRLRQNPVEELDRIITSSVERKNLLSGCEETVASLEDAPFEIKASFPAGLTGTASIGFAEGLTATVDFAKGLFQLGKEEVPFGANKELDIRLIVDDDVIELFADNGALYTVCEHTANTLAGEIRVALEGDVKLDSITVCVFGNN